LTATKVKVNVATPEAAERAAKTGADGVGLLRAEHMITQFGYHPAWYLKNEKYDELINIVYEGIKKVAQVFYPKPVWYRSFDARTDEFRHLKGGDLEPEEDNPMLGWHGIRRDLDQPILLECQLKAIKKLYEDGLRNVSLMIPFTISVDELIFAKELVKKVGMPKDFKVGIMVETPACALTIDEYKTYNKELRMHLNKKLKAQKKTTLKIVTEAQINTLFSKVYNNAVKRISGDKVPNFHELRHYFTIEGTTLFKRKGESDRETRYRILGHAVKSDSTRTYATTK
jgi:phosphoenolpyruvate synthase/pyruvate phosphate dikinase